MTQEGTPPGPPPLHAPVDAGEYDGGLSAFFQVRPRLFGIAYRMLGSVAEAEDIVQDAWLRWQTANRTIVENPEAFLATTTTRLCINYIQSARSRHESYVGPWLPEPVDTSADPGLGAERGQALNFAVLLLLEKLPPTERAAYILREAFEYDYDQIAEILQMEQTNVRQLVSRARKHIADGRRTPVSTEEQRRLLEVFLDAAQKGELTTLEKFFAQDVASYADGGGMVRAARVPVSGRERVAKFICSFASHFWNGISLEWAEANGQPAVLMMRDGVPVVLVAINASQQGIDEILWMMRPSKLSAIASSGQKVATPLPPSSATA